MIPDHYQALSVQPGADPDAVRAAYLRLMRQHHPDRRPGDPVSEERARAANAAYQVLGDSARRAAYDRLRSTRVEREVRSGDRRAVHDGATTLTRVAYSPEGERYRAALSRASLRIGVAIFALAAALLLVFA